MARLDLTGLARLVPAAVAAGAGTFLGRTTFTGRTGRFIFVCLTGVPAFPVLVAVASAFVFVALTPFAGRVTLACLVVAPAFAALTALAGLLVIRDVIALLATLASLEVDAAGRAGRSVFACLTLFPAVVVFAAAVLRLPLTGRTGGSVFACLTLFPAVVVFAATVLRLPLTGRTGGSVFACLTLVPAVVVVAALIGFTPPQSLASFAAPCLPAPSSSQLAIHGVQGRETQAHQR